MHKIDVIIPVYRGVAQTRACIESVLAAKNIQPMEIMVLNDASPDPAIGVHLAELAASARITLVTHDRNIGFVASCNLAMQLHPDRDVVLLNSDTLVSDGWLDKMVACAAATPLTASVTPFSNNATICSYPRFAVSNDLPSGISLQEFADIFGRVNAGRNVEIPTAVGFCMVMRRVAIDAVGMFDADAFGRGYGEENDWCLRATEQGFSHQLCGDVFVYHQGEVSFGGDAPSGKQHAQAVIDARYPEYRALISRHLAEDPARVMRRRVDIARLAASLRPRVLFITHNWGGGTEKHVNDLAAMLGDSLDVLVLKPHDEQSLSLQWMRDGEEFEAYFRDRKKPGELLNVLRAIGISRVHLHHVHGLPAYVLDIHIELGVPLDITLHDYFPVTQRYHLGPAGDVVAYLNAPTNDWGLGETEWRTRMGVLLASATRVIAPSHDLARRMKKYFPDTAFQVHAHPDSSPAPATLTYKVLVLGALTVEKGLKVLEACAKDAHARNLPLFFKLIGHSGETVSRFPDIPLVIDGTYRDEDLEKLIALERADAFLFPAQIPESYSYTLTAAIRANLPIVASALGAFTERLEGISRTRTIAWNSAPGVWNDTLLETISDERTCRVASTQTDEVKDARQAYVDWYLAALSTAIVPIPGPKEFSPQVFFAPKHGDQQKSFSLQQLFEIGIDRGHAPSATELRRRTTAADTQISENFRKIAEGLTRIEIADRELAEERHRIAVAENQLADASRTIGAIDTELNELRARFGEMQSRLEVERDEARVAYAGIVSSTTWRLTAPLRSMVEWARDKRALFTELGIATRRFPRDLAIARQILMAEGLGALVGRVRLRYSKRSPPPPGPTETYSIDKVILPFVVESSSLPKYSLIIPVYGQHLLTFNCIKSIAETCKDLAIEVLVVDDCSPHPVAEALHAISGITVVRNESNLGFLASCNYAATLAKGEFIVILNNDLLLTGDWLQKMEAVYQQFPDTGLVGAKLIYPDGRLQEAGGIVWRDGSAWNVGRDDDANKPEYNYVREVDYCSGACLLIKRDFWNALGGFDKAYMPAYYEDTDLAFRVREAGKKVFYQPHAVVIHFEGQSAGTDVNKGIKRHQVINQGTFAKRWAKELALHRPNGASPQLERSRYSAKRILVIDACMLTPDQDSGSLRMFEMLGLMRGLGHKVTFVASNLEYRMPYSANIQALGVEVLHHPYLSTFVRYLEQHGAEYDVIMLSRETVASPYMGVVKRCAPHARIIFDTVDLHFLRAERQAVLADESALRTAARKIRESELDLVNAADVTLVVSPVEQKLLRALAPRANVQIVSNIHVPMPGPATFAERSGILFIGGFRHPPNLDAVTWYVENVLPILRDKHPGLVTTVIGSNAPPALQRFASADFVVAGYVPDVSGHYHAARLSISPLRYGAGVKGKVNLAMQYGLPVVATGVSVEGMYLSDEQNVLVADDPEAFADAIIRLHSDEALWYRLRQGGLENIEQWFSRKAARAALADALFAKE